MLTALRNNLTNCANCGNVNNLNVGTFGDADYGTITNALSNDLNTQEIIIMLE